MQYILYRYFYKIIDEYSIDDLKCIPLIELILNTIN